MNSPAVNPQPRVDRTWLAAALCATAVVVVILSRWFGLEAWVYDSFQRYQYQSGSDQIILVTSAPGDTGAADIWSANGFAQLVQSLNVGQPSVIAATQALQLPEVPPAAQIEAIEELRKQALRSGADDRNLERLSAQVADYRKSFDEQRELTQAVAEAGNVVLSAHRARAAGTGSSVASCAKHAVNQQGADSTALDNVTRVGPLLLPPQQLCSATASIGYNSYAADADGTVRASALLINADGVMLPSMPLAVLAARNGGNQAIVVADSQALTLQEQIFRTVERFSVLTRFYAQRDQSPAFITVNAADVLDGTVEPAIFADKIVLIGDNPAPAELTYATPIAPMPVLQVTAHTLASLLNSEFLVRPQWLTWVEYSLLAALLLLVLLWIPGMPAVATAPVGLVLVSLLLSVAGWFLVSEQVWIQFGTAALFVAIAVWIVHLLRSLPTTKREPGKATSATASSATTHEDELDLEFSVLRQQPVTDSVKEKMYQIAFEHGRAEEFAKAERVLRYIQQHDPEYKDVSRLLSKLTGEREYTPLRKPAQPERVSRPDSIKTRAGRKLGRYDIESKLGEGAMATVYLGSDPNIGRKVAIKTVKLAEEFDSAKLDEAKQQFRREAESAGRLNHPNIIAIYDAGEDGEISYLAMEYFEGVALLKHAQPDDLLPASWVLELMARAADALDYAHRQNVVHRDIKPANILYNAATDELKLTDFGIARLTDSSRTKTGIILGTPSYMSPEQLMASGVTGQSDLYSLGVTMYQLLTGVAPFRADSIPKLMDKIMRDRHRPVSEVRVDLPDCVDNILNMALAKESEDRFPNGRAMAMALRDCAHQLGSRS